MINDKVAIVTGGAQGIGLATVQLFLSNGAKVVIADISSKAGKQTESELSSLYPGRVLFMETDTSSELSISNCIDKAVSTFGEISILVNGAAEFIMKSVEALRERLV